eukprot:TRINITY_DN2237_c0_g1_i6.p1 TRINITY_DN2237_c0_g1~~TRINITY_DN2237_c0_g1_i6.p1  ORF type:complete len:204 (+),score=18.90 TRINITY_DN2237_c0_g1_i6:142-753(+)
METAVWLWCYDKRWAFGTCYAPITKIWIAPILFDASVLVSTIVGLRLGQQDEWGSLNMVVKVKLVILLFSILFMSLLIWQSDKILSEDFYTLVNKQKDQRRFLNNIPHFWIRKHVLLSWAGFPTLILSLANLCVASYLFNDYKYRFTELQFSNIMSSIVIIDIAVGIASMIPFAINSLAFVLIKVSSAIAAVLWPVRWVKIHR